MNKTMKRVMGVATMMGASYGAWMMYKKMNPNASSDLKNATKNTLRKTADMLDDTAEDM